MVLQGAQDPRVVKSESDQIVAQDKEGKYTYKDKLLPVILIGLRS